MDTKSVSRPRRRKRRAKRIVATTLFLLVVFALATVVCVTMFFEITDIAVAGAIRYQVSDVIEASGIRAGQNILAIDTKSISKKLKNEFPYISSVKIARILPATVEIRVEEFSPAVTVVNSEESYTLLSDDGRILEHCQGVSTEGLPLVVGKDVSGLTVGTYLGDCQDESFASMMVTIRRVAEAVEETGFEGIKYVDVSDELCTTILYEDRALLKVGSELELSYKLRMAHEILVNQLGSSFEGTVDLTLPPKAYTMETDIGSLVNKDYWNAY